MKVRVSSCYVMAFLGPLLIAQFVSAAPAKSSKKRIDFRVCHKSNPMFDVCLKNEIQRVIPMLKHGYPKLRIPAIEPFELPALDIAKGKGAVSIDISLQKLKIYGLSSAQIINLSVDPDQLAGSAKIAFTHPIKLLGSYTARGKVQILPIDGKGPCNITLIDPVLELVDLHGQAVSRNGVKYGTIKSASLKIIKLSKVFMQLDNLFQGNPEISENLNNFVNENWQMLYEELKPAFEEAIIAIVKDIVEKALVKVPLDEIFPA